MTTHVTTQPNASESASKPKVKTSGKSVVVVELSKVRSHEQVRRLRRGRGKLATDIDEVVNELVRSSTIKPDTPPVVIVVRESTASLLWSEFEPDEDEDEDDDDYDDEDEDDDDEDDD
ncbi:MAG TPA: hypothetical protein VH678_27255 [Xanthobacteraceae bacterium]|jgi:hypothetical protein